MALSKNLTQSIEEIICESLREKLREYDPEPANMPFHKRLLGGDRMALFSFIHSFNTKFGTAIYEPVAQQIAAGRFNVVERQKSLDGKISKEAQASIQEIMDKLSTKEKEPDKQEELEMLRKVCCQGDIVSSKATNVDLYIENDDGIYLFDIKAAKPNRGDFIKFKRTLLEWAAIVMRDNPEANVNTLIAITYNPYAPKPYDRWTVRGVLDMERELMVAERFWDFLGGKGAFDDLLDCFERVGKEMKDEIDKRFAEFE